MGVKITRAAREVTITFVSHNEPIHLKFRNKPKPWTSWNARFKSPTHSIFSGCACCEVLSSLNICFDKVGSCKSKRVVLTTIWVDPFQELDRSLSFIGIGKSVLSLDGKIRVGVTNCLVKRLVRFTFFSTFDKHTGNFTC